MPKKAILIFLIIFAAILALVSSSCFRLYLAGQYEKKGQYARAVAEYEKVIRKDFLSRGQIQGFLVSKLTRAYLKEAQARFGVLPAEEKLSLEGVMSLALDWENTLTLYGINYYDYDPDWKSLIVSVYRRLGNIYDAEGEFQKAEQANMHLIKLTPDSTQGYLSLIDSYRKSKNWRLFLEEIGNYEKIFGAEFIFDLNNAQDAANIALAYEQRGDLARAFYWLDYSKRSILEAEGSRKEKTKEVLFVLEKALEANHKNGFVHLSIAEISVIVQNYSQGYWSLAEALYFSERDAQVWLRAEEELSRLTEIAIPGIESLVHFGVVYKKKGLVAKAIFWFEKARGLSDDNMIILYYLKSLYGLANREYDLNRITAKIEELGSKSNKPTVSWNFEAEKLARTTGREIEDVDASAGLAVTAEPGKDLAYYALTFGPYIELLPGDYNAYYRLKTTNSKTNKPAVLISVFDQDCCLAYKDLDSRMLKGSDFSSSGQYQDFALEFYYPGGKSLQLLTYFTGGPQVYVDRIVVVPQIMEN